MQGRLQAEGGKGSGGELARDEDGACSRGERGEASDREGAARREQVSGTEWRRVAKRERGSGEQ